MIYCFDIDGVICTTEGEDYANAVPNEAVIERIKALHAEGHTIRYYTARGAGKMTNESICAAINLTLLQLGEWGLPGDEVMLKPPADVYVDDRAVNFDDWWEAGYIDYLHAKRASASPLMDST